MASGRLDCPQQNWKLSWAANWRGLEACESTRSAEATCLIVILSFMSERRKLATVPARFLEFSGCVWNNNTQSHCTGSDSRIHCDPKLPQSLSREMWIDCPSFPTQEDPNFTHSFYTLTLYIHYTCLSNTCVLYFLWKHSCTCSTVYDNH